MSEKDESLNQDKCRHLVSDYIKEFEKVLQRLEGVGSIFSREKLTFGGQEIIVVMHLCGPYGQKVSPRKVNAIQGMKEECETQMEVRRFLGACGFYHIWIPHYAHVTEPLYGLLKNGKTFK